MSENIIDVRIDLISAEGRFRKDFGDIPALAGNINEIGLLQPIGIDAGYRLVFGERRLRAFKHLGRVTIPARFVNLDSLISGEYAENEFRKDFTVSERVEIGKALEGELVGRAGNPTLKTTPENFPELPKGDTRDIAAKAVGFGNGKTYEQAKSVVESGTPELVEELDAGRVSVSAAAKVAELPPDEQREIVQQGRVKEVAKAARYAGKPKTGPKADAIREELKAAKDRGVSMLCTYARLLLGAIRASESFTEEEREHLAEVEGAITQTKGVLHES